MFQGNKWMYVNMNDGNVPNIHRQSPVKSPDIKTL